MKRHSSYIRNNSIVESIGPDVLSDNDVLDFVINIYDNKDAKTEGALIYHTTLMDDIYKSITSINLNSVST